MKRCWFTLIPYNRSRLLACLLLVVLGLPSVLESMPLNASPSWLGSNTAWAKKLTASKMKKELEPLLTQARELLSKSKGRGLFSYDDLKQLHELSHKLESFTAQFPKVKDLVEPVFLLAQVQLNREQWVEAYQNSQFIIAGFPASPYAQRAKYTRLMASKHLDSETLAELQITSSEPTAK
ncbi:MAG: hypothetical protein ACKO34_07065 [Vampirovibrionales bacterium]